MTAPSSADASRGGTAPDRAAALDDRAFFGHPRGLSLLFLIEMWERFSYYGMRALLVLYMVHVLKWTDARADNLYGSYTGLTFLTPLFGGYLADKWIGTRRSLVIGGVIIAAGHFVLALDSMLSFYIGLGLVVLGTGFFKPNVSTMVGQLYPQGDQRRDAGFTIFYMGINLGAFIAPFVCGYLAQSEGFHATLVSAGLNPARSWSWGFGAAGVGMLCGLGLYLWLRDRYLPGIGVRARMGTHAGSAASTAGSGAAERGEGAHPVLTADEWRRVGALLLMFLFVACFWLVYEQGGSSLNLFADRYTDLRVGGSVVPSSYFQSAQPLFVILLAPLFAFLWSRLRKAGHEPSTPAKMVLGLALLAVGCLFLLGGGRAVDACLGANAATACAVASPAWLTLFYLFSVFGELCVSPVGLSYVTKVAPARYVAFLMGAWFLTNSSGLKLAGFVASLAPRMPSQVAFFTIPLVVAATAAVLLFLCVPWLKRLTAGTAV
jgi:proton-dependent oligopeptide transporter, POT family